ncbi:unnamed protein product [Macrosiphum euphorbiae]|uniref:Nuclear cap-binding protein subunit 2 n=1 Tax=Macrosiphum euphorbiae TaxID=13131 RepID=A0AAV0WVL0_9HEMI|nr:unnamed protein product [Macrosiphum euphorbiae]
MPSNCNESIRSCAFYRPPHLRNACPTNLVPTTKVETVDSVNNNTINCVNNNNAKLPNLQSKGLCTKLYVPPARRNLNNVTNVGLSKYFDCKFKGTRTEYSKKLAESTTVYVGHLNLLSTEADVHKLFSEAGKIKTIIMGLDKQTLCPGGFCFVEYETRAETEYCMKTMNGIVLDGKQLLVDWDAGFIEGRQYSRVKRNQQRSYMHPNTKK